ncbi:MAG: chemotaxis response regulator protein-glutamate methylesterase [Candidatus Marinimicrobia bacterium]|jgi:two-component system chemotaxis response regulator CheB|nr:chemotaxis response regulator protein-glutamate methylesterase [Candidatus Neomarinimicrobiota bacterium]MBT3634505.1 chemotaxis response regulator protein-glutamate methylesterase [Candidatus Neomarinimicrobiota bacterium]MBT3683402.1 chemotaxis response regulator protein-glutamate methylesterase [Candidatus Neomarinimicrobiota bacterium]MBT3760290.1 chemotaxis response regulator protein-glutamate methylesterase [Candidatus Neomarinimicrobiota bacterium]MBT3896385.1 chemotaxis response regu
MIRLIVIDDSAFMRKAISIMAESVPDIKVVATARDGAEGFEKVKRYKPDVVTLDIEMPGTNGFDCLSLIMKNVPTPVLIVSSLSTKGAETTLKAMQMGAVDFLPKTQSFVAIDIIKIQDELVQKIKAIARNPLRQFINRRLARQAAQKSSHSIDKKSEIPYSFKNKTISCVAIGVSTGGPPVVQAILESLPAKYPPILVAQHMPKEFTASFAARLNTKSPLNIKEAEDGDILSRGCAYIARGGKHLIIERKGVNVVCRLTDHPVEHLYHPSVDVLTSSVSNVYGSVTAGVILTGMGKDGVEGLKELKKRGGTILAQNEETCIVYGMPKAAVDCGITDAVLSVDGIIKSLQTIAK